MKYIFISLLLMFGTAHAELPTSSDVLGNIKRDEHGKLIAIPAAPSSQNQQNSHQVSITTQRADTQSSALEQTKNAAPALPKIASRQFIDNSPPLCDQGAITCIEAISTSNTIQASVPLTFGQPFKAGDLKKGDQLVARDSNGTINLQMDEQSSHFDGSLGFAVLSTQIANLKAGERRTINFYRGTSPIVQSTSNPLNPTSLDIKLKARVFSPQITRITFGNRNGTTPGDPFSTGEQITLQLGDNADERFTHTIGQDQAGGSFPTLTKIAEAFGDLINSRSHNFKAFKIGEGGGFENLWITPRSPNSPAFDVKIFYSGKGKFNTLKIQNFTPPRDFEADARPALEKALREGKNPRLNGAVVHEYALLVPFIEVNTGKRHPQLTARLHSRFYAKNQRIRTDMVLENNWTYDPEPGNLTYELTVTQSKQVIIREEPFTHYHHSRWHTVFWNTEEPNVHLRHHMPYFISSRAIWNYDLTLRIPDSVLAEEFSHLEKTDKGPMGKAFISYYFPSTGGRMEIGPLPRWTALYLISQDRRALDSMLANAAAAATIPIHYRDAKTDYPVSLESHPGIALLDGKSSPADQPTPTTSNTTPWSPDRAHQGSFAYIPYLITGDLFYQEETLFWATWNMGSQNPSYREGSKGLVHADQVRGQAWALRSLGEASRILPDKHPMKSYFQQRLADNLNWYVTNYPRNPDKTFKVSPLGLLEKNDDQRITAPWQNDFMALIVGQLAENGNSLAQEYFQWLSMFTVGRFLREEDGYCRVHAPAYYIDIKQKDGRMIDSWEKLAKKNWPQTSTCPSQIVEGYPNSPSGYAAYARAMLANAAGLNIPKAIDAYHWLRNATPEIDQKMSQDPTWAIVPR